MVEVCTDDLPEIAEDAGVVSIPTIKIYFRGELLDTIVGCVAKNVLGNAVNKILEDLGLDEDDDDDDDDGQEEEEEEEEKKEDVEEDTKEEQKEIDAKDVMDAMTMAVEDEEDKGKKGKKVKNE